MYWALPENFWLSINKSFLPENSALIFKDYLLNFINKRDENSHFYELTQEDIENINKLVIENL